MAQYYSSKKVSDVQHKILKYVCKLGCTVDTNQIRFTRVFQIEVDRLTFRSPTQIQVAHLQIAILLITYIHWCYHTEVIMMLTMHGVERTSTFDCYLNLFKQTALRGLTFFACPFTVCAVLAALGTWQVNLFQPGT